MPRAFALVLAAAATSSFAACGGGAGDSTISASPDDAATTLDASTEGTASNGDAGGPGSPGDGGPVAPSDAPIAPDASPASCPMLVVGAGAQSKWVHVDAPGHLAYATLPKGERILDFSSAGYMGGGVAIPQVAVAQTVKPGGGADDTPAIQAAIDAVAKLPLSGGVRGAVLLEPGTFQVQGTLAIAASGRPPVSLDA